MYHDLFYCIMYIPIVVTTILDVVGFDYSRVELIVSDVTLYLYLTSSVFNPVVTLKLKFRDRICEYLSKKRQVIISSNANSLETLYRVH